MPNDLSPIPAEPDAYTRRRAVHDAAKATPDAWVEETIEGRVFAAFCCDGDAKIIVTQTEALPAWWWRTQIETDNGAGAIEACGLKPTKAEARAAAEAMLPRLRAVVDGGAL